MRVWNALRRRPMAVPVLAIVLAFAVVCPMMAGAGSPAQQGCHSGSESAPAGHPAGQDRVAACCSSVTVPKVVAPAPSPSGALSGFGVATPVRVLAGAVTPDPVAAGPPGPPRFLVCASLLI